jgi:DNA-binding transcriptional regulator/RsmH inhibitor MraZ
MKTRICVPDIFRDAFAGNIIAILVSGEFRHTDMPSETAPPLPIVERMERALVLLAYFIELDGDVHLPMYEKFEAELTELRQKEDTKARARRLLVAYSEAGGLRAIR